MTRQLVRNAEARLRIEEPKTACDAAADLSFSP